MSWSGLTLALDTDLGTIEPESTSGRWGAMTWPNQRAEAKRLLKVWIERDFTRKADGTILTNVADHVKDTFAPEVVYGYTGSAYVDYTGQAGDDTANDVPLATIFTTAATDRLYLGFSGEADGLQVQMLDSLNAVTSVLTVKYSGPDGWTTLTATDGTSSSGKTFAKSGRITWTIPTDWQRRAVNNSDDTLLWIELSVSVALTSGTKAGQVLQVRAPDGLKLVHAWIALAFIYRNLAAQAPSTDYWGGRSENQFKTGYMDKAEELYASLRDKGGIPIDANDDGTIDPDTELNLTAAPTFLERY